MDSGTPRNLRAKPLKWRAFAAVICLPALWYALLVLQYGVNVPHYDQWVAMAPLFEAMEAGTAELS
jgi:hypothetical protein